MFRSSKFLPLPCFEERALHFIQITSLETIHRKCQAFSMVKCIQEIPLTKILLFAYLVVHVAKLRNSILFTILFMISLVNAYYCYLFREEINNKVLNMFQAFSFN